MRTFNTNYALVSESISKTLRITVRVDFSDTFTDPVYFTSHSDSATPGGAVVYPSTFVRGGAVSQDLSNVITSIGGMSLEFRDDSGALTSLIGSKLQTSDKGLNLKRVTVYKGFEGLAWADYETVITQVVGELSYENGLYIIDCEDVQRIAKKTVFDVKQTNLTDSVTLTETTSLSVVTSNGFELVAHGTSYTDAPSAEVGYIQIDDEIIRYTGKTASSFTGLTRGVLGTVAAEHTVDLTVSTDKRTKVIEVVYLELPVIKLIYAMLTGDLYNQTGKTLPTHWQLEASTDYVNLSAFTGIGADLWDTSDDSTGVITRLVGLTKIDGKQFIEQQLLPLVGCFMPINTSGQWSIRKRAQVLETSAADVTINDSNIISVSALVYEYSAIRNQFVIEWNYSAFTQDFTRKSSYVFTDSIAKYKASPVETVKLRALHGSRHTAQAVARIVEFMAERRAYPPIKTSVKLLPSLERLEVGDVVRFVPSNVKDHTGSETDYSINRAFEIQRLSVDLITGLVSADLAGSSQPAETLNYVESSTVVDNAYYSTVGATGTNINTLSSYSAGTITGAESLTGGATMAAGIWYHDGDLTIASGVTVTISDNVWLLIKGHLTVNGTIDGIGGGISAITSSTSLNGTANSGGYFGQARAMGGMRSEVGAFAKGQSYQGALTSSALSGVAASLPVLNIEYNGTTISELVTLDLRGTGGAAGGVADRITIGQTLDTGKAGGAGGAGLMVLSRGMSFGASGLINLSGNDGTAASSSYTASFIYAGSGGGGLPGAFYLFLDGATATIPQLPGKFVASSGACPLPANSHIADAKTKSGIYELYQYQQPVYSAFPFDTAAQNFGLAASRIQFVPENETAAADPNATAPPPPTSVTLASGTTILLDHDDGTQSERIKVTWTKPADPTVDRYWLELKLNAEASTEYRLVTTVLNWDAQTAFITNVKGGEIVDVRIAAVNKYDYRSDWVEVTGHTVIGKTAPPADVTSLIALQTGDNMVFKWPQVADKDLSGYELRYGPQSVESWSDATPFTKSMKGTSITSAAVPPGAWRFYIKAVDTSGNYSTNYVYKDATYINTLDIVFENEEAPDWLGTKTNLIKHWTGKLVPDSQNLASADLWDTFDVFVPNPYPTATYDAPEVDIGFDDTVRVWAAIISALGPGEAGEAAPQYAIDYKLAAGAYDGFQDWDVGEIELRYLTSRVSVTTATGVYYLSSFSHTVDLRERTQKASGIAIAAAGTLITFPISFHTAPFVRVFIDGSSALYATNTSVTTTGFTIHVFNSSGTDVGGVVNWEATGV